MKQSFFVAPEPVHNALVEAAARCDRHGGLLCSEAELEAFGEIALECGADWNASEFQRAED